MSNVSSRWKQISKKTLSGEPFQSMQIWKENAREIENTILFLATLVALHFTLVSKSVSESVSES